MILRHVARRQGRRLATSSITTSRPWQRSYASEVEGIESSLHNSMQETHSIEAGIQSSISMSVPGINDRMHRAQNPIDSSIAHNYEVLQHQRRTTGTLGSVPAAHYHPRELLNNPPSPHDITLELLLASQAHLGHSTSLWNPMNSRYIYGIRDGIHIISLDVTAAHLRRACRVVSGIAERGGIILFAGTRDGQERSVVTAARNAGGYHLFEKWIPGSITNGQQILGGLKLKVVDQFDEEVLGHEEAVGESAALKPDLVVCLNPLENWVLLHECGLRNIPTIGVIDTDADPTWVTYPIPANDDSLRCIQMIAGVLGKAGQEGQEKRKQHAADGLVLYEPTELADSSTLTHYVVKKPADVDKLPRVYVDESGRQMSDEEVAAMMEGGVEEDDSILNSVLNAYQDPDTTDVERYERLAAEHEREHGTPRGRARLPETGEREIEPVEVRFDEGIDMDVLSADVDGAAHKAHTEDRK